MEQEEKKSMSNKYAITVKKNGDTVFELESDNLQISQQREVEPIYSVGYLSPVELNVVKGSEKVVITFTK